MQQISLHIPSYDELWYRQKLMADPATMSYNRGYSLPFEGYDKNTGCIAFPPKQWRQWYDRFIGHEPERFYAYVVRLTDGAFIGEVNLHKTPDMAAYEMGIVLESRYRGHGYAAQALKLLLAHAFESLHADAVCNEFEKTRQAAVRAHLAVGFSLYGEHNGLLCLRITRQDYYEKTAHIPTTTD